MGIEKNINIDLNQDNASLGNMKSYAGNQVEVPNAGIKIEVTPTYPAESVHSDDVKPLATPPYGHKTHERSR